MAYVNVAEWSPDQTADWLKGVDASVAVYATEFLANQVHGYQLLGFRADNLDNLNICTIGHQEIILEAVAQLRNFHYELDRENLQYLALKLSSSATSLYNELKKFQDSAPIETQIISDLAYVIGMIKTLVSWLDRPPFCGKCEYDEIKSDLVKLSVKMATSPILGTFAVEPLPTIKESSKEVAEIANNIVQNISDPMILQPATLDLVTIRKKENELGFDILPSVNGIHQIIDIKLGFPSHLSGKIENGDEIVQVNYQTVVGWQANEILLLCQESSIDVLLTLKKRPRHTQTYGQVYMKPYRLPSKKRTPYNKWGSLPSPRPELLTIRNFEMPLPKTLPAVTPPLPDIDGNSSSDENEMLSPPGSPTTLDVSSQLRIYMPKPRSMVQRRNTIAGTSPMYKCPNTSIEQMWRKLRNHKSLQHSGSAQISDHNDIDDISDNLCRRDKSISCSTGLELSPRPKTCLGVGVTHPKIAKINNKLLNNNLEEKNVKSVKFHDQIVSNESENKMSEKELRDYHRERGRLDKSYSTPAYDFGENEESEFPLVKEIIPESPTSIDSPLIVVHSPEKIEQILEFKKSSEQISGAMIQQSKDKIKNTDIESIKENVSDAELNYNQIIETINIPLLEQKPLDVGHWKPLDVKSMSDNFYKEDFGEVDYFMKKNDTEQSFVIQNESVEVVNTQMKYSNLGEMKLNIKDVPPEPPPRPLSTQKPGYVPSKHKNITKKDIHVIPNEKPLPLMSPRKETMISLTTNPYVSDNLYGMSSSHMGINEASPPQTPLINSKSVQKLESDFKLTNSLSQSNINKLDTSIINLKCNTLDGTKISISPPNSLVRGILPASKNKNLKKKNSILSKRRKVSVKDIGTGEMQGYLFQRCRTKNNSNAVWKLRWYILTDNTFYGFKSNNASKAECLIFLSGFTVSVAQEVKSKPFAFKVYHTGTAFYFACESAESMSIWLENITRATLTNNDSWERASKKDKKTEESKHFSETDYSDEDLMSDSPDLASLNVEKQKNAEKQSEKSHKFGSLKKFATIINKSDSKENVSHTSTSLDRKYLRFFSSKSKNKEEKMKLKCDDVPIPTDQYRCYRKVPNANTVDEIVQINNKVSNSPKEDEKVMQMQNVAKIKKIDPIEITVFQENDNLPDLTLKQSKKSHPMNYIHASNPNLLDFDTNNFVPKPKNNLFLNSLNPRHDSFIGFVTLEQFMLNKQEEERRQMYSNRVLMGVERDRREDKNSSSKQDNLMRDNNLQRQLDNIVPDVIYGEIPTLFDKNKTSHKIEHIQSRSLPKAPDSINTNDFGTDSKSQKKSFRSKKKNGYETIKYDEMTDVTKKIDNKTITSNVKDVKSQINDSFTEASISNVQKKSEETFHSTIESKWTPKPVDYKKDLGYELLYSASSDSSSKNNSLNTSSLDYKNNKLMKDKNKPAPPPKYTKLKQTTGRQSSLTSIIDKKNEERSVFKRDLPEKNLLDSLRRNDKVYSTKDNESTQLRSDKFYTKRSEPSTLMKSSEATIVKSDKMQNKSLSHDTDIKTEHKPLKSATQYTPMSLPLMSPNKALKTSPKFELTLDARDTTPPITNISRLRQIFQHNNSNASKNTNSSSPTSLAPKEKTILGSPRLHRAIFRKQHGSSSADEWTKDFSYTKSPPPTTTTTTTATIQHNSSDNDMLLYLMSSEEQQNASNYDTSKCNTSTPDYSHLEYPPVFEPETYSLAHPGPSILKNKNLDLDKK